MKIKNSIKWLNRKKNSKKFDIEKTLERMETESDFYVYIPYDVDIDEYSTEDGEVSIDDIPEENLLEIQCKYLNGFELSQIIDPPKTLNLDRNKLKRILKSDETLVADLLAEVFEGQASSEKTDSQVTAEICHVSIVDPQFESPQQVAQILPMTVQNTISDQALEFIDKQQFVAKED